MRLRTALLLIVAALVVSFSVRLYQTPSSSMEPTVRSGETLFAECISYGIGTHSLPFGLGSSWTPQRWIAWSSPSRGDVVIFTHTGFRDDAPDAELTTFMKRCIGIAGDTVSVSNGMAFVNGVPTVTPSAVTDHELARRNDDHRYTTFPRGKLYAATAWGPMRVPAVGDTLILDSDGYAAWSTFIRREGHDVDESAHTIDGEPAAVYCVERNYIFVLGDNRANSVDSRFIGFIPVDNVAGRPLMVLRSTDPETSTFLWNRIGTIIR